MYLHVCVSDMRCCINADVIFPGGIRTKGPMHSHYYLWSLSTSLTHVGLPGKQSLWRSIRHLAKVSFAEEASAVLLITMHTARPGSDICHVSRTPASLDGHPQGPSSCFSTGQRHSLRPRMVEYVVPAMPSNGTGMQAVISLPGRCGRQRRLFNQWCGLPLEAAMHPEVL